MELSFISGEMFLRQFRQVFGIFLYSFAVCLLLFLISPSLLVLNTQKISSTFDINVEPVIQMSGLSENYKTLKPCLDRELYFEKTRHGDYWLLRNLVVGLKSRNVKCDKTITYTTSCHYTNLETLPIVVKSWNAPVSLALFAPGFDFDRTMDSIQFLRHCVPESKLIRDFVTFHIYFTNKHMPTYIPLNENETLAWKYTCMGPPPYVNAYRSEPYKTQANLTYPINIGRNIARKAANTYFIFACDIELVPSPGLVPQFLKMIRKDSKSYANNGLRVFALPTFKVKANATIPRTKTELKKMLKTKMAMKYHSMTCELCPSWPNAALWLKSTHKDRLSVIAANKRQGKFRYWEPFYISNNKEPIYDERVTWEGQSSRRIQSFAMCLLDYEYHLLHPAFLTLVPGIKHIENVDMTHVADMIDLIKYIIEPEYRVFYGNNTKCYK